MKKCHLVQGILIAFCLMYFVQFSGCTDDDDDDEAMITFITTFGGKSSDKGRSVQMTGDGGFIIVGSTASYSSTGDFDVYLIKTDAHGNELWSKTYSEYSHGFGVSVEPTSDGGYIITGKANYIYNTSNVYLVKTDDNGNELWFKTFGGAGYENIGMSVQQTSDEGYIVTGSISSNGDGDSDVYLLKTDEEGNELWSKTFGGDRSDWGFFVQQTSDGGYIIAGSTYSYGFGDVYLIKTDANGDEIWAKTFGGERADCGYSACLTNDGGYVICGSTLSFGTGDFDTYLLKTDGDGDELWSRTFQGKPNTGNSVQQTSDGGYIMTGITDDIGVGDSDVYVLKTDGNGNELWSKTFGGNSFDSGYSVQQTGDGGYVITGSTPSFQDIRDENDVLLIKTDQNGNI